MENAIQLILSGAIGLLLLYVLFVMRQFAQSVENLRKAIDDLRKSTSGHGERLAGLEARVETARAVQ